MKQIYIVKCYRIKNSEHYLVMEYMYDTVQEACVVKEFNKFKYPKIEIEIAYVDEDGPYEIEIFNTKKLDDLIREEE